MGWGMWVLMIVGTAAFWVVVLLGIRALFSAGGSSGEREWRAASHRAAHPAAPDNGARLPPLPGEEPAPRSPTAPSERQQ